MEAFALHDRKRISTGALYKFEFNGISRLPTYIDLVPVARRHESPSPDGLSFPPSWGRFLGCSRIVIPGRSFSAESAAAT
jgi:hypothetical protein